MSETLVKSADFIMSAANLEQLQLEDLPEIAVVGRSNVGKSSLINRLCGRKQLAKTGAMPGRTQLLNAFKVSTREFDINLVDLPGYGYAKVSKTQRYALHDLITDYLSSREKISGIVLLQEAKREVGEEELVVQQLGYEREIPVVVVLTKVDKLNQKELSKAQKERADEFHLSTHDLVKSGEKIKVDSLWERIHQIVLL